MIHLSRGTLQRLDRLASTKYKIPPLLLMENAGRVLADRAHDLFRSIRSYVVVVGKGNNGGDGLVAARYLHNIGGHVKVVTLFDPVSLQSGSLLEVNYQMVSSLQKIKFYRDIREISLRKRHVLIDAIFGIGLTRKLSLDLCILIDRINSQFSTGGNKIVSADIPSGLDPDSGIPNPVAIKADLTVTFGFSKLGFLNPLSRGFIGRVEQVDIGYPKEINSYIPKRV